MGAAQGWACSQRNQGRKVLVVAGCRAWAQAEKALLPCPARQPASSVVLEANCRGGCACDAGSVGCMQRLAAPK